MGSWKGEDQATCYKVVKEEVDLLKYGKDLVCHCVRLKPEWEFKRNILEIKA